MWRPTFDMAAQMTQKVQHPPQTEDEAKAAAQAQDWLNKWGKQSALLSGCIQSSYLQTKKRNSGQHALASIHFCCLARARS